MSWYLFVGGNKSWLSSSYGIENPPPPAFGFEAAESPPLPRRLSIRCYAPPLLLLVRLSLTIDILGDISSFCSRDKPVLLALMRDMPVGFLYIDGELAESLGNPDEFLCSFISGWEGGDNLSAPLIIFEALDWPIREPLWSESWRDGSKPALILADSLAANSSAKGGLLYCSLGFSSTLAMNEERLLEPEFLLWGFQEEFLPYSKSETKASSS